MSRGGKWEDGDRKEAMGGSQMGYCWLIEDDLTYELRLRPNISTVKATIIKPATNNIGSRSASTSTLGSAVATVVSAPA